PASHSVMNAHRTPERPSRITRDGILRELFQPPQALIQHRTLDRRFSLQQLCHHEHGVARTMLVLVLEQLDLYFLLPGSLELALPEIVCGARNGHTTLAAHEPLQQALFTIVGRCGLLRGLHDARDSPPHIDSTGARGTLRALEVRRSSTAHHR